MGLGCTQKVEMRGVHETSIISSACCGEIAKAEAALRDAQATADLAKIEFDRQSRLLNKGLTPQESLDMAQTEKEVTQARFSSASAELALARHRFDEDLKSASGTAGNAE
jgi:multidrug resistance efflux pump